MKTSPTPPILTTYEVLRCEADFPRSVSWFPVGQLFSLLKAAEPVFRGLKVAAKRFSLTYFDSYKTEIQIGDYRAIFSLRKEAIVHLLFQHSIQ